MSQELKDIFCMLLNILEIVAKKTANPVDDMIVRTLKIFLNCK